MLYIESTESIYIQISKICRDLMPYRTIMIRDDVYSRLNKVKHKLEARSFSEAISKLLDLYEQSEQRLEEQRRIEEQSIDVEAYIREKVIEICERYGGRDNPDNSFYLAFLLKRYKHLPPAVEEFIRNNPRMLVRCGDYLPPQTPASP